MNKKYYYLLGLIGLMAIGGFVYASPGYFSPGVTNMASNSLATTTPAFMTPGTATSTTNVYDAYSDGTGNKADVAVLLTQFSASSTNSTLNMNIEYSQGNGNDCVNNPNSCDWYENNIGNFQGLSIASTSNTINNTVSVVNLQNFSWKFASSSVGGAGVATNNNRVGKAIMIPTPTRYARVVYSCAIGGTNCTVYGQIVPNKQQPK